MKAMKKILSLLLVFLLLTSMMVMSVSAEDGTQGTNPSTPTPVTITINNPASGHKYAAYQIFSGTVSETGVLSDVHWGSGVNGPNLLTALKASDLFNKDGVNQFAGAATAEAVAKAMSGWGYNEAYAKNFADFVSQHLTTECAETDVQTTDGKYVITAAAGPGYYLVKDVKAVTGNDGATDYLLEVTTGRELSPKIAAPTFAKSVNNTFGGTYAKAIDAQMGDVVYFKLEVKLPSLYNDYKQFRMYIEDVLPVGLTFNQLESIAIVHASGGETEYKNGYGTNLGNGITTEMTHAKKYGFIQAAQDDTTKAGTLIVNFGDLKVAQPNPNLNDTIVVKYSAIVNEKTVYGLNGTANLGNENMAKLYAANDMNQTDATTASLGNLQDKASVYVYQLEVIKQDSLTKAPLKDAEFYLYRNVAGNDTTVKTYAHTDANGVITQWSSTTPALSLKTNSEGKFTIKGLDSLAYHLEEIKAPDGYNKMEEPVLVTMSASIDGQILTSLGGTADGQLGTAEVATGLVTVTVNNTAGSTLPETGGMGTTIFYVVGGIMMLAAVVLLLAKKRSEA